MRFRGPAGRSHETLMAVVRTHIQTGEPVGSRVVSKQRKDHLSPASIRNIMQELEEEGYLEQPHTSAGRVPTEKAYRYYASLCDAGQPPSKTDQQLILTHLGGLEAAPEEELLERTSHVLSLISNNLGVAVCEPMAEIALEHIHFARLGERRILVVLVSGQSQAHNHVIRVDWEISQEELDRAAAYLNHQFKGWELEKIRAELERLLAEERAAYDRVLKDLQQLYAGGMLEDRSPSEVFLEGASNLIGRPELSDPERARELFKALEEKETLIRLLSECLRGEEESPLQVVIGLPGKPPLFKDFALIGTSCSLGGRGTGRLAILGPARMPYERVICAVAFVGRLFQRRSLN